PTRRSSDIGIFVQLAPGVDGLVHISDLSWTEHIEHPADKYKKGEEVEALIIGINKQSKKISLGIKQLTPNPWQDIEKQYQVGSMIEGEVSKITNFGVFVKLPTGIEGLVHISDFSEKPESILKVGQKAQFKIVKINPEEQKIALSLKSEGKVAKAETKKESAERPKKERSSKKVEQSTGSKGKSQFQLELEKHASRKSDEGE
ncbi:S1 RNA-binding domain-containing protein, partial [Candidatus Dependentiae bacterium]|nr:S1 RNA-binding domain-containing protein [Candidatus Dependentiae bacterium]